MSHVTDINESSHAHEWVMSHIHKSHGTRINELWHTHQWVMAHTRLALDIYSSWMAHTCISLVTHMNEPCRTREWVMSTPMKTPNFFHARLGMPWCTHWGLHTGKPSRWESVLLWVLLVVRGWQMWWHKYERVLSTYIDESCRTYAWVMSHVCMSHVYTCEWVMSTGVNESWHTHEWVMSHTWMSPIAPVNQSCRTHNLVTTHT